MTGETPRIRIRALRNLDVDGVRIEEGSEAEIRGDLVAELVRIGAVDDEMEEGRQEAGKSSSDPSADAPREDGGTGGDVGASTDGPAAGAASTPAPASTSGDNQAAPPQSGAEGASGGASEATGRARLAPRPGRKAKGA